MTRLFVFRATSSRPWRSHRTWKPPFDAESGPKGPSQSPFGNNPLNPRILSHPYENASMRNPEYNERNYLGIPHSTLAFSFFLLVGMHPWGTLNLLNYLGTPHSTIAFSTIAFSVILLTRMHPWGTLIATASNQEEPWYPHPIILWFFSDGNSSGDSLPQSHPPLTPRSRSRPSQFRVSAFFVVAEMPKRRKI